MKARTQHNFTSVYSAKTSHICDCALAPLPSLLAPARFHGESSDKLLLPRRLPVVDSGFFFWTKTWRTTGGLNVANAQGAQRLSHPFSCV